MLRWLTRRVRSAPEPAHMPVNRMDRRLTLDLARKAEHMPRKKSRKTPLTLAESLACVAVLGEMVPGETYTVSILRESPDHDATVHVHRHDADGGIIDSRTFWLPDVYDLLRRQG